MIHSVVKELTIRSRDAESFALKAKHGSDGAPSHKLFIITHPHPLFGGTMDNPVVYSLHEAGLNEGWHTLRFNFRGTAGSEGSYDGGFGEQTDVLGALDWGLNNDYNVIVLGGYSFGSYVIIRVLSDLYKYINGIAAISVPNTAPELEIPTENLDFLGEMNGLFVSGERDEYSDLLIIKQHFNKNESISFHILNGIDHFWNSRSDRKQLTEIMMDWLHKIEMID